MNILQIIEKATLEKIKVQVVSRDLLGAEILKKSSRITVQTTEEMASSMMRESAGIAGDYYGVIVWVPRTEEEKRKSEATP